MFGAYGEVSEDVEKFVKEVALQAARKHAWRGGARDFNTAASCIKHRIKQDLSVAAGRARMELLLSRIDFVDAPQAWYGQQGNAKRTWGNGVPRWCREAYSQDRRGGRGRGGGGSYAQPPRGRQH